jgi:hypothetical protein
LGGFEVEIRESCDVHDTGDVGVEVEGLVHVFEIVGGGEDVVFEDDDAVVGLEDLGDAFGDVALEVVVLGALDDGHAVEGGFAVGAGLELVELGADGVDLAPGFGVFASVGEDVEVGLGCEGVADEVLEGLEHVVGAVVDE